MRWSCGFYFSIYVMDNTYWLTYVELSLKQSQLGQYILFCFDFEYILPLFYWHFMQLHSLGKSVYNFIFFELHIWTLFLHLSHLSPSPYSHPMLFSPPKFKISTLIIIIGSMNIYLQIYVYDQLTPSIIICNCIYYPIPSVSQGHMG